MDQGLETCGLKLGHARIRRRSKKPVKETAQVQPAEGVIILSPAGSFVVPFLFLPGGLLMGVTVRIPSPLRQYTEQKAEITLEGKTVGEVLESFKTRFPDAGTRFFSARTARYMNLYLNDSDIRSLGNLDTPVAENDVLSIVFAIAGG
jgi:molybdopterin synthase sulfur carrier subunit